MGTLFLAQYFGIIFTIMGIGVIMNKKHVQNILSDIIAHPGTQLLFGFIPLLLGTYVILVHNVWSMNLTVFITLVGWLMFLGGVFRLVFVEMWVELIKKFEKDIPIWLLSILPILGLIMLYVGYIR